MPFQLALSSVVVDVNASFFVQLALIIAVILICNALIFKPFLKVQSDRHHAIDAKLASAEEMKAQVNQVESQIQSLIDKSETESSASRRVKMSAAQTVKAEILETARHDRDAELRRARAEGQAAIEKAQSEIDAMSSELGAMVGKAVLSQNAQVR